MNSINRRHFSALLVGAAASVVSSAAVAADQSVNASAEDLTREITGLYYDPRLKGNTAIIVSAGAKRGEVRIACAYEKQGKMVTLFGDGKFDGKTLTASYSHHADPFGHGDGTVAFHLVKIDGAPALQGQARNADGSWEAPKMTWFKSQT